MAEHLNKVVLASAGTGKTYSLTSQYLRLLFLGEDPGKILATTFTRKAAGEIRDRVFERLVEAIVDPDLRQKLSDEISIPLMEQQCRQKLTEFVQRLDQIQISTIDAFFVRLVKLFSHDLGLPPQWKIVTGGEKEEEQTVEALASMIDTEGVKKVMEMIDGLNRLGDRSVYMELKNVVNAMRPIFLDSNPQAWDCIEPPLPPSSAEIANAIVAVEEFEIPENKDGSPNQAWAKGVSKMQNLLPNAQRTGNWEEIIATGPAAFVIEGKETYSRKEIPKTFANAVRVFGSSVAHSAALKLQKRNLEIRELLSKLEAELRELKTKNNNFTFSDLPLLLTQEPSWNDSSTGTGFDVSFRLGATINHLLLDEFQDTNPTQWRVLQPFAQKIFTSPQNGSFYCVGDVKQSIYGWRQGEPRLLSSMKTLYPQLQEETLAVSYRSSPVILKTANTIFGNLLDATSELSNGDPSWEEAAQQWIVNYPEHKSADHLHDLPGAAYLIEARNKEEEETHWDPIIEKLVERVLLLTENSFDISIGILTRTNRPISRILNNLQDVGLRASGEGGNAITDSLAVLHLLSILHFADHPGDSAAFYSAQNSPLWPQYLFEDTTDDKMESISAGIRSHLLEDGYGKFTAAMLSEIENSDSYGDWDLRRFNQLIDLAFSYDIENIGGRISDFVTHIRNAKVENPDSAGIRVMTVHAAKGLEFDAVFVPELTQSLHDSKTRIYAERPDPEDPYQRVSTAPKRKEHRALIGGTLEALYKDQTIRELQEAFCVLYVAMTRAKYQLEMIIAAPPKKESTAKNYQQLLRKSLSLNPPDDIGILWEHPDNNAQWVNAFKAPTMEGANPPALNIPNPLLPMASDHRHLPRRSPSDHFGARGIRINDIFQTSTGGALRGEVFHRLFEEVNWLEEFKLETEELLRCLKKFDIPEETLKKYIDEFRMSLEEENVIKRLSKKNQPDTIHGTQVKWEAWRERRFCISLKNNDGTETLWNGIIDRVNVATDNSGEYMAAILLDYKTDAVTAETLADKAKTYQPQLLTYREVLSEITGLGENAIETGLLFLGSDLYAPVDSM